MRGPLDHGATNRRLAQGASAPTGGGMLSVSSSANLGALARTFGFRGAGGLRGADERSDAWDRVGVLLRILGWLMPVVGAVFAIHASARMPRPDPIEVTHTVSLSQFGLQVAFPSTWNLGVGQSATDFVATHSDTGAILAGAVTRSNPVAPGLDAAIDRIIEDQRGRLGTVQNVSRGVMAVGLLDARWVKLSFLREGELVRLRTVAVQRGPSTLTLTCTGGAPAQKVCDAAIRSVTMAH